MTNICIERMTTNRLSIALQYATPHNNTNRCTDTEVTSLMYATDMLLKNGFGSQDIYT